MLHIRPTRLLSMRHRLLAPALAALGFIVTLGVAAWRGELWPHPPAGTVVQTPRQVGPDGAPGQPMPTRPAPRPGTAAAGVAVQPAAQLPAEESDPAPPGGRTAGPGPAPVPTYEEQAAARDRAAARSARSR